MILSNNHGIIGIDEVGRGPLAGPVGVGGVFCFSKFFSDPLLSWTNDVQDSKKLSSGQRAYLASCILFDPNIVCATSLVSARYIDRYGIVAAIRKASLEVIEEIRGKIEKIGGIENIECHSGLDPESVAFLRDPETSSGGQRIDCSDSDLSLSSLCHSDVGQNLSTSVSLDSEKDAETIAFATRDLAAGHSTVKILLDGKTDYGLRQELDIPLETLIKGDQKIRQIAAASIIAKVQRDSYMVDLSHKKKYKSYQFDRHKGYGTLIHRKAIVDYGLSDQHRKSFCKNLFPQR